MRSHVVRGRLEEFDCAYCGGPQISGDRGYYFADDDSRLFCSLTCGMKHRDRRPGQTPAPAPRLAPEKRRALESLKDFHKAAQSLDEHWNAILDEGVLDGKGYPEGWPSFDEVADLIGTWLEYVAKRARG